MKKILIITYSILAVFTVNGVAIFSFLSTYNALFCLGSLFVSLVVSIAVTRLKIDPVYQIVLMIGISIIAAINYLISMFMPHYTTNNIALFVVTTLVTIEVLALAGARFFSRFA